MNSPEKQLKYSIRKVSVGAASVVIGALYLLMGAGIAHAEGVESARETERTANPTDPEQSGNGETGNKADLNNTDAAANTYNAPVAENPLVAPESTKPRTRSKRELADGDTGETPAGNAGTVSEPTSGNEGGSAPADTDSALLDANRKGDVVKDDQPGVRVPTAGEDGSDDKNANLRFNAPGEDATVEEMWKIIQNMPDDFQNNERSYLRNMDTLGDALRFKNGKVSEDADGVKLQDGEIREIDSFGGWHAINKEGHAGKFAIGKKNAQGYFTGWYIDKDGKRQEGGMLGSNALDQIYVHEQALDRRFKYMLMLAKGRTIANKDDKAQDNSPFDIETANRKGNKENLAKLPVKDKEDILQHSPNIEGFNGIEKTFTAFSTKYGSRLKIDFVTGYISDYEGSKGTYRIVVKAIKKGATADAPNVEETIYDHTINRIDGVVENEERYSQGVDLSGVNRAIKKIFQDEYNKKVTTLANAEYTKKYPGGGKKDTTKLNALKEEVKQELAKKGDVIYELPIDKEKLREVKNKFKEEINIQAGYVTVANNLKNILRPKLDAEVQKDSPVWESSSETYPDNPNLVKSKDPDRVYKLLNFILPTAKKIIYHADTDQLELQTDPDKVKSHREKLNAELTGKEALLKTTTDDDETTKTKLNKEISALKAAIGSTNAYTYLEARNGSKEARILGSYMEATKQPSESELREDEYNRIKTNELAANAEQGLSKFTHYFVEKGNVERSKVISDEELSKKIHAEIGGDKDKLGKGGYFSTGDIPLGKDVVAYKIQVFAENEKRVGVNKQSPRLQYNLPILADFSVIQDTVEPSKEVTTRIITKLKEQGKITEDQEKKIKEEIKKSKKTSELRSQLSGDVKVKYQDVNGTLLTLKNTVTGQKETDLGKKGEDGTYLAVDSGLRYTNYDVTDKKLYTITTSDGKRYRLKRSLADNSLEDGRLKASDAETGTISDSPATVTFVYEEDTTPPAPAEVDATRTVKRTITYVKEDNVNGTIKRTVLEKQTKENTVTFTGKEVTDTEHNTVSYKDWTSTNSKFPKVDTPVLEGYIADIASVGEEEATAPTSTGDVTNLTKEVVYTKLGNWVPNLPKGVTPPEGTDMTPKPYPNNPNDPTKPKYPDYPTKPGNPGETPNPQPGTPDGETPGTPEKPKTPPVIPYVPGYTPKIGDKPLEPVDPNNPETGYRVPPIPETPENDTPIEYEKDPQKAVVKVFNTTTGTEVELPKEKVELSGKTGEPIPADSVITKIAELEKRGYTVENKEPLKGATFDKNKDPENGDPTQVFKLLVKERTVEVTTPPTPNTPVDPNIPDGPKWPETGLAKSDLEKEVTRTITYVKKETADGPEIADAKPTVKQTAHFKRSATYNAVTGTITYGNWESADKELAKVDTPELTGYVADKASVDKVETNVDSTGLDQKVVYTKLGSWVPRLPEGVTPPTGTDMTPKPYPNNPTDPTKPGDPTDPNTPNVPVIPYVPGYTPKIGDKPLEPVDPKHPENGYKVPPVPTEPGQDTPIEYVKDGQQKAITSFVDPKGNVLETPITETGDSNTPLTKDGEIKATIAKLKLKGYDVETNTYPPKGTFDNDPKVDQYFKVTLTPRVKPVKPFDPTDPKDPNKPVPGQPIDPDTPVDPNNPNDPTIPRWTEDLINKLETTKQVTRTINYVDEEGNKLSEPSTDKVTFTREAKINVVTGEITYGDWKAVGGDSTFDKVSSPVVKGYILKDSAQKEVAERKGITPTVANQTIEVVYKKLGSWVPKVPGVETPTPLPYPNDPTDPTKPGEPEYPQPGTPVEPNTPVIPYVPGYTPKTPDGNPLVPVDPEHPENGYKVPPVPTEPGKDTPIEYVKVPNTPSPEEPVKPTPESNHITIWVDENGKPLKPEKPGTHEPGNIPGYRYITTVTKDGVTIHRFEKITPVEPNNPVPQKPTTPIPTPQDPTIPTPESQIPTPNTPEANTPTSETNRREELPNTGTEANATFASAGIMTLLAGLGLGFFKKKEDEK
ncbi:YSIRK-type signal peptide-containing protein [Streptococcus pneumoniae]|uniref:mucin-binding protein n=1 Tax=Streptococcus pseudopneumoniae TaxID=257758 RepID=UPI0031234815